MPETTTQPRQHASLFGGPQKPHHHYSHLIPGLPAFEAPDELLMKLGADGGPMDDPDWGPQGDARSRTAGITFLGQFITHDITFDRSVNLHVLTNPESAHNYRSPTLELDCLYGLGPEKNNELYQSADPALLQLGRNDAGNLNDLPRNREGLAVIGDNRNDENKIVSQLHLAFIKFHNEVVRYVRQRGLAHGAEVFARAQEIVRWHYQYMVLYDFLPQIVEKALVKDIVQHGRRFYRPSQERITVPVEFSVAAFRFGHSIVKPEYVMNDVFGGHILNQLVGMQPVPEREVVQWRFFFNLDPAERVQLGRRIDTKIARPLFHLPKELIPGLDYPSLPTLTLLRGKQYGLPSGEAMAEAMNLQPLSKEELGLAKLGFSESPLWYYILREAMVQNRGERLGQVGGRIVAEVLIGLLQEDSESFLNKQPDWKPFLPSAIRGHFSIEDLLRFSGAAFAKADQHEDRDSKKAARTAKKYLRQYEKNVKESRPNEPLKTGRWDILPYDSEIEAVHMSLLPNGKVVFFSGFRIAEAINTETRTWNPQDGQIKTPPTPSDLFCAGHCQTADGNLLVSGGTMEYRNLPPLPPWAVRAARVIKLDVLLVRLFGQNYKPITFAGPTFCHVFNRQTEQWEFVGDMKGGRWYPSVILLPDGKNLIISGTDEAGGFGRTSVYAKVNRRLEVFDEEHGLQHVADIPDFTKHGQHQHNGGGHVHTDTGVQIDEGPDEGFPSVYPRMYVLPLKEEEKAKYPKGKVFTAGYGPETMMLNLSDWSWQHVANLTHGARRDGCVAMLPLKPPHYEARIITFGGSQDQGLTATGKNSAEMIDLSVEKPEWKPIADTTQSRTNGVAILLPTGKVLAVGGNSTGRFDDPNHRPEVYDPQRNEWELVDEQKIPRGYHCTAVLLQDGRVLMSGTTPFGKHELGMEVFYQSYCFAGPRPVVVQADEEVRYGQPFTAQYDFSWDIDRAVLLTPGSVTHAWDMNQRLVELEILKDEDMVLKLQAPPDAHVAPPGYYMLFLISKKEVPSEGYFVRVGA